MSTRSMRLRNLLVLIAAVAALVVLGCWDNRREMARLIEQGYAVNAQIVAAQFQRAAPYAFDDWRPRFVEQSLSVDLQWQGRDGKAHVHHKVPVSERFEKSIVDGQQVKLITVPIKALDDGSVPVLTLDAAARFESLEVWLQTSASIAIGAALAAAAMTLLGGRARSAREQFGATPSGPRGPVQVPIQRLMIGLVAFSVGAFLAYRAAALNDPDAGKGAVVEVQAELTNAAGPPYTVHLGWHDGQGGVHHFGPLAVSDGFWSRITRDGKLTVPTTKVRLHPEDPMGRPEIVDDAPAERWETRAVLGGGVVLLLIGAGCLLSAGRALRNG